MTLIVASIHNNSLGSVISVDSIDEGNKNVIQLSEEKLGRKLTDEEIEEVTDTNQFYCEEDSDNVWSISVGSVE